VDRVDRLDRAYELGSVWGTSHTRWGVDRLNLERK
jgi:hypothetical protein